MDCIWSQPPGNCFQALPWYPVILPACVSFLCLVIALRTLGQTIRTVFNSLCTAIFVLFVVVCIVEVFDSRYIRPAYNFARHFIIKIFLTS